jgi:hypothetical protein
MKRSRASFKYVLRKCKASDSRTKADNLAMKFVTKDSKSFWKEIQKLMAMITRGALPRSEND